MDILYREAMDIYAKGINFMVPQKTRMHYHIFKDFVHDTDSNLLEYDKAQLDEKVMTFIYKDSKYVD